MNERELYIESLQVDGKEIEGLHIAENYDMLLPDYDYHSRYERPYRINARSKSKKKRKKLNLTIPLISQIALCVLIITAAVVFRYSDADSFDYLRGQYKQAMAQQLGLSEYQSAVEVFMQKNDFGISQQDTQNQSGNESETAHQDDSVETMKNIQLAQPVEEAVITSVFDEERTDNSGEIQIHKGVDLAVPMGTPITPVMSGMVVKAASSESYGNYVIIEHENGLQSLYAHCSSIQCEVGQSVDALDVIAFAGATGDATGPHLHLEIRKDGKCIDPMQFYAADAFAPSSLNE